MNHVKRRIQNVLKNKIDVLDLSNSNLDSFPKEILKAKWLTFLDLSNNNITEIPKEIKNLKKLIIFWISGNNISEIPIELMDLRFLNSVKVENNNIKKISKGFFDKCYLKIVADNSTDTFSFRIFNNPIENPPIEIIRRGKKAIQNYFSNLDGEFDYLYEAKLLVVGEGGAGKTTLCQKILNESYQLKSDEESTKGIDIIKYNFQIENTIYRMNMWDFGGQEIYHSTHQFFLTKRSVYVLIGDTRKEDINFNYWLNVIELLGEDSPLIIVHNEKQDRTKEINERALKARFSSFKSFKRINLKTDRGLNKLKKEIKHQLSNLPHIGTELPIKWIQIRQVLENEERNHITTDLFFQICSKNGIKSKKQALYLSEYLHDLGVFLHFQDNSVLKRYIILKTNWGTDAVYKLLDHPLVIKQSGRFDYRDLEDIWVDSEYNEMSDELLELMVKFELCYNIDGTKTYIVPQLLKVNQPVYSWKERNNLTLKFTYNFLPKGLVTRFIVRMHRYISNQKLVWKEGVILERDNTLAEIKQTYDKNEILIKISGTFKKEFLTIIVEEFEIIHRTYPKLEYHRYIPCNCFECKKLNIPYFFKYDNLRKRRSKGKILVECEYSYEDVDVIKLIDDTQVSRKKKGKKYKHELKLKLRKIVASGKIEFAIRELIHLYRTNMEDYNHDKVILLSSRNSKIESEKNDNVINHEEYNIQKNKIIKSLLSLIQKI